MTVTTPLMRIPVGIIVERRKAKSPWIDHVWRPLSALAGRPETAPWTALDVTDDVATFYAGGADVELFRSETTFYRDNLASGAPMLWVVLRPTGIEPPYELVAVTANPSEGEAIAGPGTDLVETVAMPDPIHDAIAAFVDEHHVEQVFYKRKRDKLDPRGRRAPADRRGGDAPTGEDEQ